MHDTTITIVGNVATKPERRRIPATGDSVLNFRVGTTSRRFDKASGAWVDGNSFFVRVNCWRALADNAFQSLFTGDPVIVTGRIYCREYQGDDGLKRVSYEMDATAVGHNMTRGTTKFSKSRPGLATDVLADAEAPPLGELVDNPAGQDGAAGQDDVAREDYEAALDDQYRDAQARGADASPVDPDASEALAADPDDSRHTYGTDPERAEPVGVSG